MPKFFIEEKQLNRNQIEIQGEDVNHIKNVLRKKIGDCINICCKDTQENFLAEISCINNDSILCNIKEKNKGITESKLYIHIFQGLPKVDKMELIIQKGVELGMRELTPVAMKRCVVKLSEKDVEKKIERWQKISEIAAKQCGRDVIPQINSVVNVKDIGKICKDYDAILVAYENEDKNTLKQELGKLKKIEKENIRIAVVIGPEGGIDSEEVEILKINNAKIVTLGKRILRTETVALSMLSIIAYELEL